MLIIAMKAILPISPEAIKASLSAKAISFMVQFPSLTETSTKQSHKDTNTTPAQVKHSKSSLDTCCASLYNKAGKIVEKAKTCLLVG